MITQINHYFKYALTALCLMLSMTVVAQNKVAGTSRSVKGTVVDQNNEPIIGATITIVGQKQGGSVTDLDGNFTLQVPEGKKIKVSYIGYQSQTVSKLDGKVRVVLEEDENTLDDVVVVGYGALKQKNVTGAVEVINPEELKDLSVSNLSEALIGLSPALHVSMPSTGRPGENAYITIRSAADAVALTPTKDPETGDIIGVNSPRPLYVIDDFVYQDGEKGEEEFNNLDIDEVESISILKDAAAAVYNETTLEGFPYVAFDNLEKRVLNDGQQSYISNRMERNSSYQLNFMLMYGRKFGKHDVSGTFSIERGENDSFFQYTKGTHPLSFTDGSRKSFADDTVEETDWSPSEGGNLAYIGRLNYAYDDRYLFEFLIRSQASAAKFSPENYWGAFPSFSAGWVASEEKWFPKEKLKIDFLKFRASYGIMGRDNVAAWQWLQLYSYNPNRSAIFGTDISKESSRSFQLIEKRGFNRDLHWDKNVKMNFGIDLRMFDSRLSLSFDTYYDKGREMFAVPNANFMPYTAGTYPAPENYSEMDLWGYEAIVGWRQRINKDTYVSARLGFSYDDNKVLKYFWDTDPKLNSIVYGERSDRGLWGLSCIGMFRSYQQIEEYFAKYNITSYLGLSQSDVHPGMLIYEDLRGEKDENGNWTGPDGKITENEDMVQISKWEKNPYTSNLNLNFVWKSFSMNATFQAEWGAYRMMPDMYQETFKSMETTNLSAMWNDMFIYEDVLDAQGRVIAAANPNGRWPNIGLTKTTTVNTKRSTFWKMSAAEVLLRNVSFAYTLPKNVVKSIGLNNVRFNMTIQNALSLYNACPGGYWNNFAGNYGSYPVTRKITFGMNVTF